jgi:hypothetical protein
MGSSRLFATLERREHTATAPWGQLDLGLPSGTDSPAYLRSERPTRKAPLARPVLLRLDNNALG